MQAIDLTGKKFGKLTVLKKLNYSKSGHSYYWECKCECGKIIKVSANNLKSNHTKSCGCYKSEKAQTHKHSKTRLYNIYYNMKSRCYNTKNPYYYNYGGRGVIICDEWLNDFETFYNWAMNNSYKENLTIDRIDVNGNYEPNNCRWITIRENSNNKRNNHFETYNGETHTIAEWARILGINNSTLNNRLTRHSFIEAINM